MALVLLASWICGCGHKEEAGNRCRSARDGAQRAAAQGKNRPFAAVRIIGGGKPEQHWLRFFRPCCLRLEAQPVHILQFGDSHTASDDWVNSMRFLLQTRFGNGGPGFVQAGTAVPWLPAFRREGRPVHLAGTRKAPWRCEAIRIRV